MLLRVQRTRRWFYNAFVLGPTKKRGFTMVLLRLKRKHVGVTIVLLRVQRKNSGFTLVLLRVQ